MYVCMYVLRVYVFVYVCVYVCMYVLCVYVFVYVCVCMYVCVFFLNINFISQHVPLQKQYYMLGIACI